MKSINDVLITNEYFEMSTRIEGIETMQADIQVLHINAIN